MKVSREQVAENRGRILDAASRLFRERGFDAVTVAEVMQAAGLTHGGFYGHFASKSDLIAQTLAHLLPEESAAGTDLTRYAKWYLTRDHRNGRADGCPVAALGAETVRQPREARAVMTTGLRRQIASLSRQAPGKTAAEKRRAAIGSWSAMVGGLILARLSDDPELADEVLTQTRAWIEGKDGRGAVKR